MTFPKGYQFAKQAFNINESSLESNKWLAILAGSRGEFLSTADRIASGQEFKKHIDIAIRLNPNDATLYHLLGRFNYEVKYII